MTTALIENSNPILHALTNVFELFNVDRDAEILLPQSSPEEIGQLLDKYDQSNGNLCVVYFNLLSKKSQGKDWKSNTYRFWCGFFKELGLGYEGSDVACLISQIKQRNERTTASEFSKKLFDYIKSYVEENQEKAELKKYICGNNKDKWHRVTVKVIEDEDFSFARAAHDSKTPGEKEDIILRLSYLVTALRESILWGFKAEGKNEKFDVLIIDDRLYGLEYASYKALLCCFWQTLDSERDQSKTKQTIDLAQKFLERSAVFTKYTDEVTKILADGQHKLFDSEVNIFRFYLNKNDFLSAKSRLKNIEKDFLPILADKEPQLIMLTCELAKKQNNKELLAQKQKELKEKFPEMDETIKLAKGPKNSFVNKF